MNRPPERGSHTAETSFIEGNASGSRVHTQDSVKIQLANETLTQKYPNYGKDGNVLTLKVSKKYPGKVVFVGPRGGETPLFKNDNQTINPKLPKSVMKTIDQERTALIQQKDEEIEEIDQNLRDDQEIVDNENEEPAVRERTREKIKEKTEQRNALLNERERLEEGLSLRERVKDIFKKYGFTVAAVLLAVGTTIGAILGSLSKGLKSVANGVGNGLQTLGKKIAGILPGLLGAIVSFVFRAAGQVISFLGKNAWLLIIAVAVFLIERVTKRSG